MYFKWLLYLCFKMITLFYVLKLLLIYFYAFAFAYIVFTLFYVFLKVLMIKLLCKIFNKNL